MIRRSSVRSVVRGDDDTVSLVDASTLTSSVGVAREMVGSRMARRQMSKSGNMKAGGRSATNAPIVYPNAPTTAGLVGAFDFCR